MSIKDTNKPRLQRLENAYEFFHEAQKTLYREIIDCLPAKTFAYYSRGKKQIEVHIIRHSGERLFVMGSSGKSYWVHYFRFLRASQRIF